MTRAPRMPYLALTTLTLLTTAALLSTTACSSDSGRPAQPTPATNADTDTGTGTGTGTAEETTASGGESVAVAPDLDMVERVVLRQDGTRGNASLKFGRAKKGDGESVIVAARCEGKGTIEVVLRPLAVSFPLKCLDGEVTSVYNQFAVDGADRAGTVSVTAAPEVRWSLSVGRGEPSGQDHSG